MPDTPLRHCSRCDEDKPADAFRSRRRKLVCGGSSIYFEGICKACHRPPRSRERVAVGPFKDWIENRIAVYGTLGVVADLCGVAQRSLYRVLHENLGRVNVDLVDRCLCGEGSTSLIELYPEVYEFEVAA